jgi:hemerythrin-like domain-containing protein
VRKLVAGGLDYEEAARRLGIPAGQAYMIATGVPADGGDTIPDAEMAQRDDLLPSSQHLANPPHHNPTTKESVRSWIKARVAADDQMRTAARQRTAEPPEIEDPDDVHDAITVLGRQHSQVRYLLKQLQALPSHTTGGSPEHMSARKSIVDMITVRLSEHETIEEEHFWPAVRKALPDGDQYADSALEQEQEGKDTLTELGRLDPDSREFDEHVEQFVLQVRKHVAFEEQVFLKMRESMQEKDLDRLGEKLLSAMKTAPTRRDRPAKRKGKATGENLWASGPGSTRGRSTASSRASTRSAAAPPPRAAGARTWPRAPARPTRWPNRSARTARSAAARTSMSKTTKSSRSRATRTRRSAAGGCARKAPPASSSPPEAPAVTRCSTGGRTAPTGRYCRWTARWT